MKVWILCCFLFACLLGMCALGMNCGNFIPELFLTVFFSLNQCGTVLY